MATSSSPYVDLNKQVNTAMDELVNDESHYVPKREAEELFLVPDAVQIFFVRPDGRVTTFSEPTTLRIFKFKEKEDVEKWVPTFIQVGGWTHPLIPGASPVLEASNGAFMFPDVYADDTNGAAIGIVLADEVEQATRDHLRKLLDELTALKSNPQEPDQRLGTVGTVLVKGAELVNKGLDFGAEKACNLIEYEGNRQKEKMGEAADQDTKVNSALKYSIKGVGYATYATVKVSGFVANRVGKLTKNTADYLAKKIEKPISGAVVGSGSGNGNGSGMTKSSSMRHILDAARGGLIAYGTVYAGLEENAKVLGKCLKEESVEVVQHKYGGDAGEVYGEAMTAAGNGAMTYLNVASLGVKGLVKKTAKQTAKGVGKGVLETYGEKKMADADADGNKNT